MDNNYLNQQIISNLIDFVKTATSFSSHNEAAVFEEEGSLYYFTGCEFPFFNGVFNNFKNKNELIRDDLQKIINFFSKKRTPFIWWWIQQDNLPSEIKYELESLGFQLLGELSGIGTNLHNVNLDQSNDLIKVKSVENEADYRIFMDILSEAFEFNNSIKKDMTYLYNSYREDGKFRHYLGFYQDKPVSTLTGFIKDKTIGFYNGATLASAQKQGVCTALGQHLIRAALVGKCEYGISQLMVSGMAKGLSEKMGFKKHCRLLAFLKT